MSHPPHDPRSEAARGSRPLGDVARVTNSPVDVFRGSGRPISQRRALLRTLAVIAVGGALGAAARFEATIAWPVPASAFPATILIVNVVGSALIGLLMVGVVERWPNRQLLRPFLGTGVLGGFTSFSTYAVDVHQLLARGMLVMAAAYLLLTPILAVLATMGTARATRRLLTRRSG